MLHANLTAHDVNGSRPVMGIDLVKSVAIRYGNLTGNEHKVLVYMAAVALDRPNSKGDPARLYFAGWDPLATALGLTSANPKARQNQVGRVVASLIRKGLLTRLVEAPGFGRRQCYKLHVSPSLSDGQHPSQTEGQQPIAFARNSPSQTEGPRKKEDQQQDLHQESITHHTDQLQTARARVGTQ